MRKFLLKTLLLALPVLILGGPFVVLDPFRVIWHYDNYSDGLYVVPNRDLVSTRTYMNKRATFHYDSFIFGSSRTLGLKTGSWRKYLPTGASPFVFDASGESVFGMSTKIDYLDRTGAQLHDCVLLLCTDRAFRYEGDMKGHLYMKHPTVAGTSWFDFYSVCIKDYFDAEFLLSYFRFLITGVYLPSMHGYIENRGIRYDPVTNDMWIGAWDKALEADPVAYYKERSDVFYTRDSVVNTAGKQMTVKEAVMLHRIRQVFDKHHTRYRIIITPLYDQFAMNEADVKALQVEFGKENVFDLSGINVFTQNREHYYEDSHFRPFVGDSVFALIYSDTRR